MLPSCIQLRSRPHQISSPSHADGGVADAHLADTQQQAPGSFKFVIVTALASCVHSPWQGCSPSR